MENVVVEVAPILGYVAIIVLAFVGTGCFSMKLKADKDKAVIEAEKWKHAEIQRLQQTIFELESRLDDQRAEIRNYRYGQNTLDDYTDDDGQELPEGASALGKLIPGVGKYLDHPLAITAFNYLNQKDPTLIPGLISHVLKGGAGKSAPNTPPQLPQNTNSQVTVQG